MKRMFYLATTFNQNISSWNVANVTDMSTMFRNASVFSQDLSTWTTSSLENVYEMFWTTNIDFDLSQWDYADVNEFTRFVQGVNLSVTNWSNLLVAWASEPSIVTGDSITSISQHNAAGASAISTLEGTYGWTINDAGLAP